MSKERVHLFDKPENVQRLLWGLYISCAVLFALDFIIDRHSKHPLEHFWGFYPIYGFVGCVLLVQVAKVLRYFLMRPEDYYEPTEQQQDKGEAEHVDR